MDHLQRFTSQVRDRLIFLLIFNNLLFLADWWIAEHIFQLDGWNMVVALCIIPVLSATIIPWLTTSYLVQPTRLIWQAILHIAPDAGDVPAPDLKKARLGRELVTSLVTHIYQIANVVDSMEKLAGSKPDLKANFIANNLPLPLLVLDKEENIVFANKAMLDYLHRTDELAGQNVYSVLDLAFTSDQTFDKWLEGVKAKTATATKSWERVRLQVTEAKVTQYLDMAAYYNQDNLEGMETMLVFFDRTRAYSQDDQAMGFVALAVHELRTPLTLLRGYVEVFEEELDGKLDEELAGYLKKMQVSAQQLTAFTNNILNVSRFENDQLILKLHEEKWEDIVASAVSDMRLRASVQGIDLKASIEQGLPTVGVDRVSAYEVINNLIDNAIKYSGDSKEVRVSTQLNREGLVETTIQDFGVGVPEGAVTNLFDKFYRNHRNRAQIGGTGLGLYLAKAIVDAHGGQLWVDSKVGKGSTFGFTVLPYSQLAAGQKNKDNKDVTRSAHGWIKNHSLYRR